MWTEPMDHVTDKEDAFQIGVDEQNRLVGVTEEFLKDRIERFRGYKVVLMKRQGEYEDKLSICKADLTTRKFDAEKATSFLLTAPLQSGCDRNQAVKKIDRCSTKLRFTLKN